MLGDTNLDETVDDDNVVISRFNEQYDALQAMFALEYGDRRIPCYIHIIQLIISEFSKVSQIAECFNAANKMIKKIKSKLFVS